MLSTTIISPKYNPWTINYSGSSKRRVGILFRVVIFLTLTSNTQLVYPTDIHVMIVQ